MHEMNVHTPRLVLREPRVNDALALFALLKDETIARNVCTALPPEVTTLVGVEGLMLLWEAEKAKGKDHRFVVELPGFGVIGLIGVHETGVGQFNLRYWIGRDFRRNGYATEAAQAAVGYVLQNGAQRVTAGHFADNPASGRVLEKAGFAYTGEVRDMFSLGRSERAPVREMAQAA
jgi:RimJ/RimL family protein N-acetyltransferase